MGGKRDNKEWDFNQEHSFPRILEYERKSDIKEVDIMEFRVNAKLHYVVYVVSPIVFVLLISNCKMPM
jgi:hypothetical protein